MSQVEQRIVYAVDFCSPNPRASEIRPTLPEIGRILQS